MNVDIIVHNRLSSNTKMSVGFSVGVNETSKVHNALKYMDLEIAGNKRSEQDLSGWLGNAVSSRGCKSLFSTLSGVKIASHMISTSEIKISAVIHEDVADQAVRVLHEEFVKQIKKEGINLLFFISETSNDSDHAFDLFVS